ncbi:hypothetical protein [Streptomyces sp. NPDC021224]|uniref:hypothetical protein n=1 Tax=unclassified Streptomyces TaxID=2593676 RepID=UPI0037A52DD5
MRTVLRRRREKTVLGATALVVAVALVGLGCSSGSEDSAAPGVSDPSRGPGTPGGSPTYTTPGTPGTSGTTGTPGGSGGSGASATTGASGDAKDSGPADPGKYQIMYKIVPPKAVGTYKLSTGYSQYVDYTDWSCADMPSDSDCTTAAEEIGGVGVKIEDADRIVVNASGNGGDYGKGKVAGPGTYAVVFRGLQGSIPDPAKALDRMVRSIRGGEQAPFRGVALAAHGQEFPLNGVQDGALECRSASSAKATSALCVWADHYTVAAVQVGLPLNRAADLTKEFYRTARVKVVPREPRPTPSPTQSLPFHGYVTPPASATGASTYGYAVVPPKTVDGYTADGTSYRKYVGSKSCGYGYYEPLCAARVGMRGTGITPADAARIVPESTGTGADYHTTTGSLVTFRALQGRVADPRAALYRMIQSIQRGEQTPFVFATTADSTSVWTGRSKTVPLSGFKGAVMVCLESRNEYYDNAMEGRTTRLLDFCVWADHSAVGATMGEGVSLDGLAATTADLYRASRARK